MYEEIIRHYPNFPIPGIDFLDVMPFLQNKDIYRSLVHEMGNMVTSPNVATVEARGFLFASPLLYATEHVHNIIPIRKKGKLPSNPNDLHSVAIEKEYGQDQLFYRLSDIAAGKPNGDVFEVSLFDDLLATGGTAIGIANALNQEHIEIGGKNYGVRVKEFVFLIELTDLGAASKLEAIAPVHSIVKTTENSIEGA